MDIKGKFDEIVKKVTSDKEIADKFAKNPGKTIEEIIGIDLPDEQVNQVIAAVKAKVTAGKVLDGLGGLFGKKS